MKLCFFELNKEKFVGELNKQKIYPISDVDLDMSLYQNCNLYAGDKLDLQDINIITPLPKNKIVYGVADNFNQKSDPLFFFKGISDSANIIEKNMDILVYSKHKFLWAECELGFIVAKDIPFRSSKKINSSFIYGYFLANDITSSLLNFDHHLICSKSSQRFLHISHFIETDYDSMNKKIILNQDGVKLREGNTKEMALNEFGILEELKNFFDIKKGDSIILGAPQRCRERMYLENKHELEMTIEGFETLKTRIFIKRF
tara:strand:+ start:763 stop:1539 length:777 start_codon:yes stop_codon:yes gene_type:complete